GKVVQRAPHATNYRITATFFASCRAVRWPPDLPGSSELPGRWFRARLTPPATDNQPSSPLPAAPSVGRQTFPEAPSFREGGSARASRYVSIALRQLGSRN